MSMSDFLIASEREIKDPSILQLFSFPTPNGIKVSAMLEETGLAYEAHSVSIMKDQQFTPGFLQISPNNKIPAIVDPDGPGGKPVSLFESGAILIYLAEKTGQFLSKDPVVKAQTLQWVMWQMGGLGPMAGQLGFFYKFAGKEMTDKTPLNRYIGETKRLLGVFDKQLEGRSFVMGDDYCIADIAIWPWVQTLITFYDAAELLEISQFENVSRWLATCKARPASQSSLTIPPRT